ncbi:MAG: glycoside hydrolase family 5 protein, partial [Lachnospiraceae bacterium]|nr:glycoside hydrolase family 5 protein [Lachnospiraceae bacterium]
MKWLPYIDLMSKRPAALKYTEFYQQLPDNWQKYLGKQNAEGNPRITAENFAAIREAGFKTVRIPVSWEDHMDENQIISENWMKRVGEVVDMALAKDLYVIIDLHHEKWLDLKLENEDEITEQLKTVWKQIAQYFSEYDDHLIFESMNEPRLCNSEYEWTSGTQELKAMVNRLNEAFVEVIRSTGERIIVSIHAYISYDFCQNEDGTAKWNDEGLDTEEKISETFSLLNDLFIKRRIPVMITEFGCKDKNNLEDCVAWTVYFTDQAKKNGIGYIWWDCGDYGLLNREENNWSYPEIVDVLTQK